MAEERDFDDQLALQLRRLKSILPCCPNCIYFTQHVIMQIDGTITSDRDACGLDSERRRPPARVIAFGCPAFEPGVPF